MGNKLLVVIVLVVAVIGGYYYATQMRGDIASDQQALSPAEIAQNMAVAPQSQPPSVAVQLPAGSVVGQLKENTALAMSVYPKSFDPAIEAVVGLHKRLQATQVWSKLNLEEHYANAFAEIESELNTILDELKPQDGSTQFPENLLDTVWRTLKEVSFALNPDGMALEGGARLPAMLVTLQFTDNEIPNLINTKIQEELEKEGGRLKNDSASFEVVDKEQGLYRFEVTKPTDNGGTEMDFKGLTRMAGDQLMFGLFMESFDAALAGDTKSALTNSARWNKLSTGLLERPALVFFMNPDLWIKYMGEYSQALEGAGQGFDSPEMKEILDAAWGSLLEIVGSMSFNDGIENRSCVGIKPDSPYAKLYAKLLEAHKRDTSAGGSSMGSLINDRSLFGLRIATRVIVLGLESAKQQFETMASAVSEGNTPVPGTEMAAELPNTFGEIQAALDRFGFKHVGVLINAPVGGPMPEAVLLLESGKLAKSEVLGALAEALGTLSVNGGLPLQAQQMQASDGTPLLQLQFGPQFQLVGKALENGSVVLGMNEFGLNAYEQAMVSGQTTYLDGFKSVTAKHQEEFRTGDYFAFLNTKAILQMLAPMAPMMLQANPDMNLTPNDIDEIIALLSGQFAAVQTTRPSSDPSFYCAEGRITQLMD